MRIRLPSHGSVAAALALLLGTATASSASRPAIVELYTSEGCSSCPPAERLIEDLAAQSDVLPLAFHVDYWDGLGWRDRFSMKEATQRQQEYAQTLGLATVGTPQLIVEGRTAMWGANPAALKRALTSPRGDVAILVERNASSLVVRTPDAAATEPFDVYVVGYLPKVQTVIRSGENAGRTLTEVNVVRYIRKIGQSRDVPRSWNISLDQLPRDAERVVVLLQASSSGAIIGARAIDPPT